MPDSHDHKLDQNEVDALLAAMGNGGVALGEAPSGGLSARPVGARIDVQVYDFKRPERVSKDQIRSLEGAEG